MSRLTGTAGYCDYFKMVSDSRSGTSSSRRAGDTGQSSRGTKYQGSVLRPSCVIPTLLHPIAKFCERADTQNLAELEKAERESIRAYAVVLMMLAGSLVKYTVQEKDWQTVVNKALGQVLGQQPKLVYNSDGMIEKKVTIKGQAFTIPVMVVKHKRLGGLGCNSNLLLRTSAQEGVGR